MILHRMNHRHHKPPQAIRGLKMYTADHNQFSCMHAILAYCSDSRTIMSAAHPHNMRTHGTTMCKCKRIATTAPTRRDSTGAGGLSSITPPIVSSLLERWNPRHTPSRPLLHYVRLHQEYLVCTIPPSTEQRRNDVDPGKNSAPTQSFIIPAMGPILILQDPPKLTRAEQAYGWGRGVGRAGGRARGVRDAAPHLVVVVRLGLGGAT